VHAHLLSLSPSLPAAPHPLPPGRGVARTLLSARGLRCTEGRALVLDTMLRELSGRDVFTTAALHARLVERNKPVSLPALYGVLATLRDVGLVELVEGPLPASTQ
jgi:Fe2+ or Zn2+ uptake regulation protein